MPLSPRLEGWKAGVMTDRWTGPRWETSGLGGHSCSPGKEERSGGAENRAFFQGEGEAGGRGQGGRPLACPLEPHSGDNASFTAQRSCV